MLTHSSHTVLLEQREVLLVEKEGQIARREAEVPSPFNAYVRFVYRISRKYLCTHNIYTYTAQVASARRHAESSVSARESELQSKARELSTREKEMKQSHEAREQTLQKRERELEAEQARLQENQQNAAKWITAAEKAQVTEREVSQRVRAVKSELKDVEARAQAVEDDARARAQAIVNDAIAQSAHLDAREQDLAGLAAVLDGREHRCAELDRDLQERLTVTRKQELAIGRTEAEIEARLTSLQAREEEVAERAEIATREINESNAELTRATQVRSPKLTVGFSQSSYILMSHRVVGAGARAAGGRAARAVPGEHVGDGGEAGRGNAAVSPSKRDS
jgi:hypothetical protein